MKKFISYSVLAALLLFGAASCKKYEEGPGLTLKSKKARVANIWEVESAKYVDSDGIESDETEDFKDDWGTSFEFDKEGKVFITYSDGDIDNLTWSFDDAKENILLTWGGDYYTYKWEIQRLASKELWVKWNLSTTNSAHYYVKFKQK